MHKMLKCWLELILYKEYIKHQLRNQYKKKIAKSGKNVIIYRRNNFRMFAIHRFKFIGSDTKYSR